GSVAEKLRNTPDHVVSEAIKRLSETYLIEPEKQELIARMTGSPISYVRASLDNLRGWMADIDSFRARVLPEEISGQAVEYAPTGMTGIILAGDEVALAGYIGVNALLAKNPTVMRPSTLEAISATEFVRALPSVGLEDHFHLVYWPRHQEQITQHLLDSAKNVVLIGSDSTVEEICVVRDGVGRVVRDYRSEKVIIEFTTGNSASIIAPDAHLRRAAIEVVHAATMNKGAECINAGKVYVPAERVREFANYVVGEARRLKHGDPLDPQTNIGLIGREAVAEIRARSRVDEPFGLSEVSIIYHDFGEESMGLLVVEDPSNASDFVLSELPGPTLAIIPYTGTIEDAVRLANKAVEHTRARKSTVTAVFTERESDLAYARRHLATHKVVHNLSTGKSMDGMTSPHHGVYPVRKLVSQRPGRKKPDVVVLGAGAIGLTFAGYALQDGKTVALVGRKRSMDRIRERGVNIPVRTAPNDVSHFDVGERLLVYSDDDFEGLDIATGGMVITASKTPALDGIVKDYMGKLAHANPSLLMVQNGVHPEGRLAESLRQHGYEALIENIVGGVVTGMSSVDNSGEVPTVRSGLKSVSYGVWDGRELSPHLRSSVNNLFFAPQQFVVAASAEDYRKMRFHKAIMNGSNVLSGLFQATVGDVKDNPWIGYSMWAKTREAVAVAREQGSLFDEHELLKQFGVVASTLVEHHLASMGQDIRSFIASPTKDLVTEIQDLDLAFVRLARKADTRMNRAYGLMMEEFTHSVNVLRHEDRAKSVAFAQRFIDMNRALVELSPIYGTTAVPAALKFFQEEYVPGAVYENLQATKAEFLGDERAAEIAARYQAAPGRRRKRDFTVLWMDGHGEEGAALAPQYAHMFEKVTRAHSDYSHAVSINSLVASGEYAGQQALKLMDANKVDLLVADVKMPHMDGAEVTRGMPEDVGVMVLSEYKTEEEHRKMRHTGGNMEYLQKTDLTIEQLFDAVSFYLHRIDVARRFS
ncbi:MAG: aldehyde dehydrogenase family protein, partial [Armatimonadetes bacterium]